MCAGGRWCGIWYEPCSCKTRSPPAYRLVPLSSSRSLPAISPRRSFITSHNIFGLRFTCGRTTIEGARISTTRCSRPTRPCCWTAFSGRRPTLPLRRCSGAFPGRALSPAWSWGSFTSGGAIQASLDGIRPPGSAASCGRWESCSPRTTMGTTETPISSLAISSAFTMRRLGRSWRGSLVRAAGRAMPAGARRGGRRPGPNRESE